MDTTICLFFLPRSTQEYIFSVTGHSFGRATEKPEYTKVLHVQVGAKITIHRHGW